MKKIFTLMMTAVFSVVMFAATETTVYYTAPASEIGSYTVKLNVNFKGDGDEWHQYNMTLTNMSYNNDPVYTYTYTDMYDGVGVMQFQLYDGDNWKSQKQAISTWTFATEYNGKMYVHATEQWVAAPGEGGGDQPGGGDNPGGEDLEESGEGHDFALMGSIGGDWNIQEQLPEFMFDARGRWSGTLASHPAKQNISYVVMIDEEGNQYKTKGWAGENATSVTLYWANGFENSNVWQLPAGETIYLIMRKCTFKGSIEVEKVDQATYDAYTIDWGSENQAIENTIVTEKARKQIIDGQLVIIRGDKMYDATGKAL